MWKQNKRAWSAMEVAAYTLAVLAAIVATIAKILSSDGHSDLSRWVYCGAIVLTVIGGFAWYQDKVWKKKERDSPQSAQQAGVPDASSDNQHDTKPPAIAPDVRPPHVNPTPGYIAKIIWETASSSRGIVKQQFIGTPVSWDGRLGDVGGGTDDTWRIVKFGLDETVSLPGNFFVPVDLPKNKLLLQLPIGSRIHVDGVIDSFIVDAAQLKDITVEVVPDSPGTELTA